MVLDALAKLNAASAASHGLACKRVIVCHATVDLATWPRAHRLRQTRHGHAPTDFMSIPAVAWLIL
jgi:hypothetical protein